MRRTFLLGILTGILLTLATLFVRDTGREIFFRLDRIEQYLTQQAVQQQLQQQMQQQSAPQSHHERSHKGELSKPEHWKV